MPPKTFSASPNAFEFQFIPMTRTIFALSSGSMKVRSGVAVVRISGPATAAAVESLTSPIGSSSPSSFRLPAPRRASLRSLYASNGSLLDKCLLLYFPAPASFTGLDVAELHLHGAPAIVRDTLDQLARVPGLEPAQPGEFTRQAFEEGKLNQFEVEALADLGQALTSAQRERALSLLYGNALPRIREWRALLLRALAMLEAEIDFGEDLVEEEEEAAAEDERHSVSETQKNPSPIAIANDLVSRVKEELIRELRAIERGSQVLRGAGGSLQVVLRGAVNVGKTSLLNTLAGRDAGIVSSEPGTTRDIVECGLELAGQAVLLSDTAGLRETDSEVEQIGQTRGQERAENADVIIHVIDANNLSSMSLNYEVSSEPTSSSLTRVIEACLISSKFSSSLSPALLSRVIVVINKNDLLASKLDECIPSKVHLSSDDRSFAIPVLALSTLTGDGIDQLVDELTLRASRANHFLLAGGSSSLVAASSDQEPCLLSTRSRHRAQLDLAQAALEEYSSHDDLAIAADLVDQALRALTDLIGERHDKEDVLDIIYSEFCIGK